MNIQSMFQLHNHDEHVLVEKPTSARTNLCKWTDVNIMI